MIAKPPCKEAARTLNTDNIPKKEPCRAGSINCKKNAKPPFTFVVILNWHV
jgi:hypothetical protein